MTDAVKRPFEKIITGIVNSGNEKKGKASLIVLQSEKQCLCFAIVVVLMSGNKSREILIKLLCPSLSKLAEVVAWEDQRIDLGSISRAFGLDPSTLRLNGHFISRGLDLIASSLTWNSLLSFFSSKGFSTGKHQSDALLVTGKLCKLPLKRMSLHFHLFLLFQFQIFSFIEFLTVWITYFDFNVAHLFFVIKVL